jgi:hypothetical protein
VKLLGFERVVFALGVALYLLGLFGAFRMLTMPPTIVTALLAAGGGCLLFILFTLIF